MEVEVKYMENILHVPNISKDLVSVGPCSMRVDAFSRERGRNRFGRVHVEAFEDTSNVVGLGQKQSSSIVFPTNLNSENVSCRTEVLHDKLQPQFPKEFGELSGMPPESSMSST